MNCHNFLCERYDTWRECNCMEFGDENNWYPNQCHNRKSWNRIWSYLKKHWFPYDDTDDLISVFEKEKNRLNGVEE